MLLCSKLIQRCQDDFYDMEYMDYHESNYNWLDIEDKPDLKKLDVEMKRTDQLLYQMIPKKIADRLRAGEAVMNLCEVT